MNILIIEDDVEKLKEITGSIENSQLDGRPVIDFASNYDDSIRYLYSNSYDLIVFDFYLPRSKIDDVEVDCSDELLIAFSKCKSFGCETIAITKYEAEGLSEFRDYNIYGITVVNYDTDGLWRESLAQKVKKISQKIKYDFLIFCALEKERDGFFHTGAKLGNKRTIGGLNCQEICVDGLVGMCITPSRMGLVCMSITVAKAIDMFQPELVAMSGICAGFEGSSNYLDLIVADICWEYQTGKFKDGEFKQEPYQRPIDHVVKTMLDQVSTDDQLMASIKEGQFYEELRSSKIAIGPMSSGSVVIADEKRMGEINEQHRKMLGLDMEMYSMYEAAAQSTTGPKFFGVKAVVDLGNGGKNDKFHSPACIISARFVMIFLKKFFLK